MLDLYALSADLRQPRSPCSLAAVSIIADIDAFLKRPGPKTALLAELWRADFRLIYGDVSANLSGNRRLDPADLLARYGLDPAGGEGEAVVRLLFAIQTYFSLLLKTAMADLLGTPAAGDAAVIMGDFARERGIENYVCEDCFCWPLFELEGGFGRVMDRVRRQLAPYRVPAGRSRPAGRDDIRLMYEALVPRELRHALGEYYTPDWLAEAALGRALEAHGGADPAALRVLDPTCGSGTFLLQAIAVKRRAGCGLAALLDTVRGLDINPLAVLTAKTNYLLAVLDLLEEGAAVILPVFRADVLRPPPFQPLPRLFCLTREFDVGRWNLLGQPYAVIREVKHITVRAHPARGDLQHHRLPAPLANLYRGFYVLRQMDILPLLLLQSLLPDRCQKFSNRSMI